MDAARAAVVEDLPAIAELARAAIEELSAQRGGAQWRARTARREPIEPELAAQLERSAHEGDLVVGTIDGAVVGYGATTVDDLADGSRVATITDLYVTPAARGVGVGEAMMELLVAAARTAGATGVDSLALPGDRETKNFFETFGLKARAIVVHRSLVDEGGDA